MPCVRTPLVAFVGLSWLCCEAGSKSGAETGAPSPVCLSVEELAVPGVDSMCVESEGNAGHLWLEVPLAEEDPQVCESAFAMDARCRVREIRTPPEATRIALDCDDDILGELSAELHVSSPELRFPVCDDDALDVRYESSKVCGTGGIRRALTIRRPGEADPLAVSFDGAPKAWFSPFELSIEDSDCDMETVGGCSYWRGAMRVAFDDTPPVHVYDGTLRSLSAPAGYVAASQMDRWDEACCADCSFLPRGALVYRDATAGD